MTDTRTHGTSYREVPMAHPEELCGAARYLMHEWGETGYSIGFAGRWIDSTDRDWAIFQCRASDGSRFLIRADRYGNAGYFESSLMLEIADLLDVECHA